MTPSLPLQVLKVYLGQHCFGIDILTVQDVIRRLPLTSVPLAAPYVLGLLNLRGHVVTEIDMAQVLEVKSSATEAEHALIIEYEDALYSLVFDRVDDVLTIDPSHGEPLPDTIDEEWKTLAQGIYRLEQELVVLLNPHAILTHLAAQADASRAGVTA